MTPPPKPFRLVYRAFKRIEFDPAKSDEVLEGRGFDLGYVSRIFPGYVLERPDTRTYSEPRFKGVGEYVGGRVRSHLYPAWRCLPGDNGLARSGS